MTNQLRMRHGCSTFLHPAVGHLPSCYYLSSLVLHQPLPTVIFVKHCDHCFAVSFYSLFTTAYCFRLQAYQQAVCVQLQCASACVTCR